MGGMPASSTWPVSFRKMGEGVHLTEDTHSTRRTFLKAGAIIATPLAVVAPGVVLAADDRAAQRRSGEDEAAIRALHHDWLRRVNAGSETADLFLTTASSRCLDDTVSAIVPDYAASESIKVAGDGKSASGRFLCQIDMETRLVPQNTLAQMALAQGGGITRRSERRLIEAGYVKSGGSWAIMRLETRAV